MLPLAVLSFVRKPWALYLLVGALGVLSAFYVGLYGLATAVSIGTSKSLQSASVVFWWGVTFAIWFAYFWRRRWWFGIPMPFPAPSKSPKGGILMLWAVSVALAFGVWLLAFTIVWFELH
jgi:hypothetical protein